MTDGNGLYLAKTKLTVEARGYWFTSGGEKGSFGYYPHLKIQYGDKFYPVYPDTQIKGDMLMAARWLKKFDNKLSGWIERVFGVPSEDEKRPSNASKLFVTDLELKAIDLWEDRRFQVKPRIKINDETRVVEQNMLVSLEMAWLDDLKLTADMYLGYFKSKDDLAKAKSLIEDILPVLSGFGAFRSRGYGRGTLSIDKWCDESIPSAAYETSFHDGEQVYTLTTLTNMRNKPIEPAATQLLESQRRISSEQIRGWFVHAYNNLYKDWPSPAQMASVRFSDFYPAIKKNGECRPGYPVSMSTLRNEDGRIKDLFDDFDEEFSKEKDEQDNFFNTKTKSLPAGSCVTDSSSPEVVDIRTEKRTRNQTDSNFTTIEGGLFVQELILKGTVFSGKIQVDSEDKQFEEKAKFILKMVKPLVNGCLFKAELNDRPDSAVPATHKHKLVISPLPFDDNKVNFDGCGYHEVERDGKKRVFLKDVNLITLGTERKYNITLQRPRRPKIIIQPGSVIHNEVSGGDEYLSWTGLGQEFIVKEKEKSDTEAEQQRPEIKPDYFNDLMNDITRNQAGIFREFLNEKRKIKEIRENVEHRIKKYDDKKKEGLRRLYEDIRERINNDNTGEEMRRFIRDVLGMLHEQWWAQMVRGERR